jgi:hypothetical protein
MVFDRARRLWTSLLVVGVPIAIVTIVWFIFVNGRPIAVELAGAYLLVAVAGRAHAAEMARRAKPGRLARVKGQVARVKSTLPGEVDPDAPELAA